MGSTALIFIISKVKQGVVFLQTELVLIPVYFMQSIFNFSSLRGILLSSKTLFVTWETFQKSPNTITRVRCHQVGSQTRSRAGSARFLVHSAINMAPSEDLEQMH